MPSSVCPIGNQIQRLLCKHNGWQQSTEAELSARVGVAHVKELLTFLSVRMTDRNCKTELNRSFASWSCLRAIPKDANFQLHLLPKVCLKAVRHCLMESPASDELHNICVLSYCQQMIGVKFCFGKSVSCRGD
jgi:hypothetical protein